ncbi:MAG: hypothetical protein AABY40_01125 [Nanoarchaeota archaeon]
MKQSTKMMSSLILYAAASCGTADKVTHGSNYETSTSSSSGSSSSGNDTTTSLGGFGGNGGSAGTEYNGGFGGTGIGGDATGGFSGQGGSYDAGGFGGNGGSGDNTTSTTSLGGFGGNGGSAGAEYNGGFGVAGKGGETNSLSGSGGNTGGEGGSAGGSYNNSGGFTAVGGYGGSSDEGTAGNYNGSGGNNTGGSDGGNGGNGGVSWDCGDLLGKFTTYSQGGWHNHAASLLPVILSSGEVVIGDKDQDYAAFTTPDAITGFLPAVDAPGALQGQYTNPTATPAGVLAGQTLTLKLNLAINSTVCGSTLDDLVITEGTCINMSVGEVKNLADLALAGTSIGLSYSDVNRCVEKINLNFKEGNADNNYLTLP